MNVPIAGNLCRCTGYRPIVDGYRTFCEVNSADVQIHPLFDSFQQLNHVALMWHDIPDPLWICSQLLNRSRFCPCLIFLIHLKVTHYDSAFFDVFYVSFLKHFGQWLTFSVKHSGNVNCMFVIN